MITVLLAGVALFILAGALVARGIGDYNRVRDERRWEQVLHVADSGIDATLFQLSRNRAYTTGEFLPSSFASRRAEETWARQEAAANPAVTVPEGQWAVVKPLRPDGTASNVIYSVGYVPSRANPAQVRVIRAEYDFAPFAPGAAVLTNGDLSIPGNPSISGAGGNVHSNQNVTINGNPTVSGYVSASGSYTVTGSVTVGDTENSGGGRPRRDIPDLNPRDLYGTSQYDLCPDGTVRAGPAYVGAGANTTGIPCSGSQLAANTAATFRGWKKSGDDSSKGAVWDYSGNAAYDGVYYVYQGSANVSGNPGDAGQPWHVTIVAEAIASGPEPHCPHVGGDIAVSGNPKTRYHPGASPMLLIAGRDLQVSGNPSAGETNYEGVMFAHEQFAVAGNPRVNGVLIAGDPCDTVGSPVQGASSISGNPTITYDGTFDVPFASVIRTTLWLEL